MLEKTLTRLKSHFKTQVKYLFIFELKYSPFKKITNKQKIAYKILVKKTPITFEKHFYNKKPSKRLFFVKKWWFLEYFGLFTC